METNSLRLYTLSSPVYQTPTVLIWSHTSQDTNSTWDKKNLEIESPPKGHLILSLLCLNVQNQISTVKGKEVLDLHYIIIKIFKDDPVEGTYYIINK